MTNRKDDLSALLAAMTATPEKEGAPAKAPKSKEQDKLLETLAALSDRTVILERGAPDALFGSPQEPETQRFLERVR